MKDYDNAIVWLRKSVETLPNLWYNRAYLVSAFALAGRHEQPEARAALGDYNGSFSGYTAASDASGSLAKLLDATVLAAGTPLDLIGECRSMSKLDVRRRS